MRVGHGRFDAYPEARQTSMFDVSTTALARWRDPETSRTAARRLSSGKSNRYRLLRVIATGPCTAEEAARVAGIDPWQASKRVSDLKNLGYVEPTGDERVGVSGRSQQVLRVTFQGVRALERVRA